MPVGYPLNGKVVDLLQLRTEMLAVPLAVPHALGILDDYLVTYNDDGDVVDVPTGTGTVVTAHTPIPPVDPRTPALEAIFADPAFQAFAPETQAAFAAIVGLPVPE